MSLKVYQSKNPKYAGHTAGPWKVEPYVDAIDVHDGQGLLVACIADRSIHGDGDPPHNAALIADAPFLACEVERLEEKVAKLEAEVERLNELCDQHESQIDKLEDEIESLEREIEEAKGGDE